VKIKKAETEEDGLNNARASGNSSYVLRGKRQKERQIGTHCKLKKGCGEISRFQIAKVGMRTTVGFKTVREGKALQKRAENEHFKRRVSWK